MEEAPDGNSAIDKVRSRRYLLVLSDLKLPGNSGIDVLREARRVDSTLPFIILTAYGSVEEAVTAMKEGAYDFIQKPVDLDHLKLLLERAARQQELLRENLLLREEYAERYGFPRIVGDHPSMKEASQMTQRVAATDSTVMLLGESGTGKELFARAIHHLSPRAAQPFVALNCAAIPEGLVENELFGHERGAYTGAGARKIGKLELAHRGTLFLDEIGELPLAIQSKLLRVLEERRFERVGGTQEIEVSVRIVTATNKDLRAAVADKTFREDLFFRIAAVPITVPPLRDRGDDVILLAEHFLDRFKREFRKPELSLAETRASGWELSLAGKRSRIAKCHRARSHPGGRFADRYNRLTAARPEARPRRIARRHARRAVFVGRPAGRGFPARCNSRGTLQNTQCPSRIQVEQNTRRRKARRLLQNPPAQNPRPRPRELKRYFSPLFFFVPPPSSPLPFRHCLCFSSSS